MVRCEEFYEKWKRDPNWCEKGKTSIFYINKCIELREQFPVLKQFSEGALRPLLTNKINNFQIQEIISQIQKKLDKGEKASVDMIRFAIQKASKLGLLRRNYRTAFIRNHGSLEKHIINLLRDEKPYFRKKEDLEVLYQAVMRYGKDPFTAFVEDFWLQQGKLKLPPKFKGGFAVLRNRKYETEMERETKPLNLKFGRF